ncbi:DNA-binding SARP family transcriptional activator [Micromonospora kangleipakensis]|uniref:DNA-binding SARP family transcriptional activator n=1 Tax=Micromonospora kangleipakensis TaxID=1077942 RepID=A0A4Q8B4N5_9ACTN|nr:BTAD domain-containing putative transcriptional regulator [Micromonospora kangleipakensis]RZU71773.1 DNA-binding SARP family transcriptional activator [Micromonospora kangleipakensis]
MSATLRFEVLGPQLAWYGDRELDLGPGKQRAVLAVLLLSAGRPVPTGQIVDAVWPEEPPANGPNVVQKYVAGLRRVLEPDRSPRTPGQVLSLTDAGYLLRITPEAVDAVRFERGVQRARQRHAAGRTAEALAELTAALKLWQGEPFTGFAGPVFEAARHRLVELRAVALETRADLELESGRHRELVGELVELVAEFPVRERLRYQLMLALHRGGRQAEALAAYREFAALLREEYGIEPGEVLRELHRRILRADPTLVPARIPAQAVSDPPAPTEGLPAAVAASAPTSGAADPASRPDVPAPREDDAAALADVSVPRGVEAASPADVSTSEGVDGGADVRAPREPEANSRAVVAGPPEADGGPRSDSTASREVDRVSPAVFTASPAAIAGSGAAPGAAATWPPPVVPAAESATALPSGFAPSFGAGPAGLPGTGPTYGPPPAFPPPHTAFAGGRPPRRAPVWLSFTSTIIGTAVTLLSFGFLTWVVLLPYAVWRRSWRTAIAAACYLALVVAFVVAFGDLEAEAEPSDLDMLTVLGLVIAWLGGALHVVLLNRGVWATVTGRRRDRPGEARRLLREQARYLLHHYPAARYDLRIGRPDLPRTFDDGGLVDINAVPEQVVAALPGLTPAQYQQVVMDRWLRGPFTSMEELAGRCLLPPTLTDSLRDLLVFLPPPPQD